MDYTGHLKVNESNDIKAFGLSDSRMMSAPETGKSKAKQGFSVRAIKRERRRKHSG